MVSSERQAAEILWKCGGGGYLSVGGGGPSKMPFSLTRQPSVHPSRLGPHSPSDSLSNFTKSWVFSCVCVHTPLTWLGLLFTFSCAVTAHFRFTGRESNKLEDSGESLQNLLFHTRKAEGKGAPTDCTGCANLPQQPQHPTSSHSPAATLCLVICLPPLSSAPNSPHHSCESLPVLFPLVTRGLINATHRGPLVQS